MNQSYDQWQLHVAVKENPISVTWSESDIAQLSWQTFYATDEIPQHDNWNTFATKQKIQLEELQKNWGIEKQPGRHYMCIRPRLNKNIEPFLNNHRHLDHTYNFLKLTPGCMLPWHFDTYATFVKFNGVEQQDIPNVCRTAVMMTDWDRGQVFQIGNQVYSHWCAGDAFTWKGDTWHGLCNFGPSDIVIGQITFYDQHNKYSQIG